MATQDPEVEPQLSKHAGPAWPPLDDNHPLASFASSLPEMLKEAEWNEVYGIDLETGSAFHRNLILQKFLRANADNLERAKSQLLDTLKWRKSFQPLKAKDDLFSNVKFGGLGYVTMLQGVPHSSNQHSVATFNIYGAAKNNKETFGDLESFMHWRIALMELSVEALHLQDAQESIPDYGKGSDQYQGFQIHDYLNVSFLRQDPHAKAAAKQAIETFGKHYPETLCRKFFVNVPVVMVSRVTPFSPAWSCALACAEQLRLLGVDVFSDEDGHEQETARKMTVVTYGKDLAEELGPSVPEVYGGKGPDLASSAKTPKIQEM